MKVPIISIIVPVYKAEKYLQKCLNSISSQTFKEWECILVDDGSPDNSGVICEQFAEEDKRFKVIHKKNSGVSAARQTGLDNALGKYIIHADPDDWAEPNWLSELYDSAVSNNSDLVICDFWVETRSKQVLSEQHPIDLSSNSILKKMFRQELHGSCWNKLVKRELFLQFDIHFPKGINLWEDLYVNCEILSNPIKVTNVQLPIYHYVQDINDNSLRKASEYNINCISFFIEHFKLQSSLCNGFELYKLKERLLDYHFLVHKGHGTSTYYKDISEEYLIHNKYRFMNPLRTAIRFEFMKCPDSMAWIYYKLVNGLINSLVKLKHIMRNE